MTEIIGDGKDPDEFSQNFDKEKKEQWDRYVVPWTGTRYLSLCPSVPLSHKKGIRCHIPYPYSVYVLILPL